MENHHHSFEGFTDFSFNTVIEETQEVCPFLISIFSANSGNNDPIHLSKEKLSMIYAVLMNIR